MHFSEFSPSSPRSLRSFFGSSQSDLEEPVSLPDYYRLTRQESYGPRFEAEEVKAVPTAQSSQEDNYHDYENGAVQFDITSLSHSLKYFEDDEDDDFDSASNHSHSKSLVTFCDYDLEYHASNPTPNPSTIVAENKSKPPSPSLMSLRAIVLSFFRLKKGRKLTA